MKNIIRRSISIPKELDDKINVMSNEYSYSIKNELYLELLVLGMIKFDEDIALKNLIVNLLSRLDELLNKLENK